MILVIDNYDSFTYNLVQYLGELGAEPEVVRNDAVDMSGISAMRPERIVISPGPGTPDDAGISLEVIRGLGSGIPILGVCLGHQAIGQAFGATVARARRQMHGKTSAVEHDGRGVFRGVPSPFSAVPSRVDLDRAREDPPGQLPRPPMTRCGAEPPREHARPGQPPAVLCRGAAGAPLGTGSAERRRRPMRRGTSRALARASAARR